MDVEIGEMQKQLEGIIRDMEQGKEVVQQKSEQLSEYEKQAEGNGTEEISIPSYFCSC